MAELRRGTITLDEFEQLTGSHSAILSENLDHDEVLGGAHAEAQAWGEARGKASGDGDGGGSTTDPSPLPISPPGAALPGATPSGVLRRPAPMTRQSSSLVSLFPPVDGAEP